MSAIRLVVDIGSCAPCALLPWNSHTREAMGIADDEARKLEAWEVVEKDRALLMLECDDAF